MPNQPESLPTQGTSTVEHRRRQIAVLIDFENIPKTVSPTSLVQTLRERGRLVVKKAFADWSNVSPKTCESIVQASIELEALSAYRRNGKNAADIRLVVEAMEIAIRNPVVDTFVIVSGDSDYIPLVVKLRELGKYVILVADRLKASRVLTGFCDELIPFARLTEMAEDPKDDDVKDEYKLLQRCFVSAIDTDEIDDSALKQMLLQLDPAFHERNFGHKKFSAYLSQAQRDGVVKLRDKPNGGYMVRLS